MGAWFESHIGGRATRPFTGFGKRDRFGMRSPPKRGYAATDDYRPIPLIGNDQRTDGRIRSGPAEMTARIANAGRHEATVELCQGLRHGA